MDMMYNTYLKDFEVYDICGIMINYLFGHGDNQIYLNTKMCVYINIYTYVPYKVYPYINIPRSRCQTYMHTCQYMFPGPTNTMLALKRNIHIYDSEKIM